MDRNDKQARAAYLERLAAIADDNMPEGLLGSSIRRMKALNAECMTHTSNISQLQRDLEGQKKALTVASNQCVGLADLLWDEECRRLEALEKAAAEAQARAEAAKKADEAAVPAEAPAEAPATNGFAKQLEDGRFG